MVEKVRIRNTVRVIVPKSSVKATKGGKSFSKEKICQDFKHNNCKQRSDHIVDGSIIKYACSFCFKEVLCTQGPRLFQEEIYRVCKGSSKEQLNV